MQAGVGLHQILILRKTKKELGHLRSDNDDLRGMKSVPKERLGEMSSAQQGTTGQGVDRDESSAAGDAPGVPAAEFLVLGGHFFAGVTERRITGIRSPMSV